MTLAARAKSRPFLTGLVCGGAHAACYAIMFPPVFLWGLAFVALAPLMWLCWALGGGGPDEPGARATGAGSNDGGPAAPPRLSPRPSGGEATSSPPRGREVSRAMRRALLGVFLAVMPMWAFHHSWIAKVTPVGFPVLVVYLSVYAPVFVWLGARWKRRVGDGWRFWLALPVIWVGLEMVRGAIVWDGYPWFYVGHPLVGSPGLAAPAEVIGAIGVSLMVAVINVGFGAVVSVAMSGGGAPRLPPARSAVITVGASVLVAGWFTIGLVTHASRIPIGAIEESIREQPRLAARARTIAVVQTNVPQDNRAAWRFEQRRADFEQFKALTRDAAGVSEIDGRAMSAPTQAAIGALLTGKGAAPPLPAGGAPPTLSHEGERENKKEEDNRGPDLIVWPETMFPGLALNDEAVTIERAEKLLFPGDVPSTVFVDELLALQRDVGAPMLVGAVAMEGLRIERTALSDGSASLMPVAEREYNSAFVIDGGRVQPDRYDKVKLTPFGEYMPYISWSDWLEDKLLALGAGGMRFNLSAGRDYRALEAPHRSAPTPPLPVAETATTLSQRTLTQGSLSQRERVGRGETKEGEAGASAPLRVATPICFEATMPGVCRRLVFEGGWDARRRADVLINMTNDGWFADSPGGRENHLLAARWRCVELGTPMVRAANTGVSCVIDASGRVTTSLEMKTDGVMRAVVALPAGGPTLYARTGDVAGWMCLCAAGLMGALTFTRRRGGPGDRPGPGGGSGLASEAFGANIAENADGRANGRGAG